MKHNPRCPRCDAPMKKCIGIMPTLTYWCPSPKHLDNIFVVTDEPNDIKRRDNET